MGENELEIFLEDGFFYSRIGIYKINNNELFVYGICKNGCNEKVINEMLTLQILEKLSD